MVYLGGVKVIVTLCGLIRFSSGSLSSSDCQESRSCMDYPWNLVFIQQSSIRSLRFSNNSTISEIYQNDNHRPAFLTSNVRDNVVYWTDEDANGLPAIYRIPLNTSFKASAENFVDSGIYRPRGIAYDWITHNLYFVDSKVNKIVVCAAKKTPTRCSIVFKEDKGMPLALAVSPNHGVMFWTTEKYPAIRKASMDGSSAVTLVSTDINLPKVITVDETNVFWYDYKLETLESIEFDGSNRRILGKRSCSFGIGILGDSIFWSYPYEHEFILQKANKENGQNRTGILDELLSQFHVDGITDINLMHVSTQPISRNNSCDFKNCSHNCVLSGPNDAVCICRIGFIKNGTSCLDDTATPKLFVAQHNTLLAMKVGTIGSEIFEEITLPSEVNNIAALVYNPMNNSIIIYDGISETIFNFKLETKEVDVLVENGISNLVSIDIDLLSQNLFWLDAGKNQVELFSLKSHSRIVIYENVINGNQIQSDLGTINVANTGRNGKHEIREVSLEVPVGEKLLRTFSADLSPVQISCDQATHMLLIASSNGTHITIQSEHTADNDYIGLSLNLKGEKIDSMTSVKNQIFWVDHSKYLKAFTPAEILNGEYLLNSVPINDNRFSNKTKKLIALDPGSQYMAEYMAKFDFHLCSLGTNYCPHFCIPKKGHVTDGACMCEMGFELQNLTYYVGRQTKCIEANSSGITAYNLDATVEANEFVADFNGDVNSKGESVGWLWPTMILCLLVLLVVCTVAYKAYFWRKTRSIPLIIFRNDEE